MDACRDLQADRNSAEARRKVELVAKSLSDLTLRSMKRLINQ